VAALRTQVWNGSLIIRGPSVVLAILGRNAISPRRGLLIYQAVNSPMPHSARNATSPHRRPPPLKKTFLETVVMLR
jgi:hypothetical protein